jgi:ribose transport system permease protein
MSKVMDSKASASTPSLARRAGELLVGQTEGRLILLNVALGAYLTWSSPYFLTLANLKVVMQGLAEDALLVAGMTILIISGVFDLSVGAVLAFAGVIAAKLTLAGWPPALAFVAAVAAGAAVGVVNGLLITVGRINALIATLGMAFVVRGLIYVITQGFPVSAMDANYSSFGQGAWLGIPNSIVLMIVVLVVADFLLRRSEPGRAIYYLGGNEQAARLAGFNVVRTRVILFGLMGALAALAGVVVSSRLASAGPSIGVGAELRAIAAAVIGGASLSGGRGSIRGAFLGLLLMALITNALILTGVSIYLQSLVTGALLILAMLLDSLHSRARPRH